MVSHDKCCKPERVKKVAEKLPEYKKGLLLLLLGKAFDSTSILSVCVELFPFLSYDFKRILSDEQLIVIE